MAINAFLLNYFLIAALAGDVGPVEAGPTVPNQSPLLMREIGNLRLRSTIASGSRQFAAAASTRQGDAEYEKSNKDKLPCGNARAISASSISLIGHAPSGLMEARRHLGKKSFPAPTNKHSADSPAIVKAVENTIDTGPALRSH